MVPSGPTKPFSCATLILLVIYMGVPGSKRCNAAQNAFKNVSVISCSFFTSEGFSRPIAFQNAQNTFKDV